MIAPSEQLELFRTAVAMIGGQRPAARYLKIGERHLRKLWSGASPLHDGFLEDLGRALLEHAEACRELERKISPAFARNLTDRQLQRQANPDGRGRPRGGERTIQTAFEAGIEPLDFSSYSGKVRRPQAPKG